MLHILHLLLLKRELNLVSLNLLLGFSNPVEYGNEIES